MQPCKCFYWWMDSLLFLQWLCDRMYSFIHQKIPSLRNMWSSSVMCTSALTKAPEVSTSSPHLSLSFPRPRNICQDQWNLFQRFELFQSTSHSRFLADISTGAATFRCFPLFSSFSLIYHILTMWSIANLSLHISLLLVVSCQILHVAHEYVSVVFMGTLLRWTHTGHSGANCC